MGSKRKYCSAQPYLDYIGVSERERKEWNKEVKMSVLSNKIKIGSLVNVHFAQSESIFRARVAYVPQATGDSWRLVRGASEVFYVQMFERVDLIDKED